MNRSGAFCVSALVFCVPAHAGESLPFTPARFGDGESTLPNLIKFPGSKKDVDVRIKCDTVVSDEAELGRVICYGPDRYKISYKKAIYKVIEDVEVHPATVNGAPETVVMQYTVRFVRQDGVENIRLYPNHGHNVVQHGDDYIGVQRYDWGHWSSKGCRRHQRRFVVSTEAIIASDGNVRDYKLVKGNQELGDCEQDVLNHVSNGSYLPATKDGVAVEAKYVEIYLNYLDPNVTY